LGWPDIIHANNFYCPGPVGKSKLVYTLYDLAVFSHPDLTTEANRLVCANGIFRASLYADFIVAISNSTRSHFLNTFPHYPDDRVAVVYPASRFALEDGTGRALKGLSPGTFWLAVGTLEPRKNWRGLLKAYAGLRKRGRTERLLVMAGSPGWMEEDLPQYIKYLGIEEFVIRTGYIPDAQLRWLYAHCFAFVYPSLFEGFGMPVLEAMSMGAAVITSNASSLPEVAGDAGIMVDPHDPGGLAEAMLRLENDPKLLAGCRSAGLTRSENFSWDRSASLVLAHYEALAG
jgi:glycosyltransferase involved in cell wall biosynthesis